MHVFRGLIAQRRLAILVCALTLLLKLIVPAGYMIAGDHGRLAITLCPGTVAMPAMAQDPAMAGMHGMHGMAHDTAPAPGKPPTHGHAEMPCAFAGLATASLAAIDPVQLAALIVFILAIAATRPVLPSRRATLFLRPPLRGPPLPL